MLTQLRSRAIQRWNIFANARIPFSTAQKLGGIPESGCNEAKEASKIESSTDQKMRISKWIAMAGICSRRQAEKKILSNQVVLNGNVLRDVGQSINPKVDRVTVDGIDLMRRKQEDKASSPRKVWLAHKLKGELVTTEDPQGRRTIFDRFRQMGLKQHLMPVGRLDYNTEGLLVFTNDGEYARQLEHPKFCVERTYRALVRGNVLGSKIDELARGATVNGVKYRPIQVSIHSTDKKDSWLQVKLREGKNREVRNALAHVRLIVKRLIRVRFGPYRLADLPSGSVLEVIPKVLEKQNTSAKKIA